MTLLACQIFSTIAHEGSFARTAEQLHLTPSAISHAVSTMETECGFPLFTRTKSGVTMTAENLFWAFAYNVLGIPLAAGVFIPLLHWQMNPMYGAAAMSLSSFCVVSNALRLNLFDIRSTKHDHKRKTHKTSKKENTTMNKTIKIEGMMCGHCESTVKKALEAMDGVSAAEVSHTAGTAVVTLDKPVDDTVLKKAVEDKDYTVTGIE